jgi:FAD/FMN-containing dehydrogenase
MSLFENAPELSRATPSPAQVSAFKAWLQRRHGPVFPNDPGYDAARKTYNALFDGLYPWAVVYCASDEDIRTCLAAARALRLPFRLRSGGHSFAGYSSVDGGLVFDLTGLGDVRLDPATNQLVVGGGATMQAVARALGNQRLLPIGDGPVGIGGFMQGGGFGAISRTYGLNCDHVLQMWVMLADGRVVLASRTVNPDLWWAMRGGTGGNFGVLLEVRYQLQPRAQAPVGWELNWPLPQPLDPAGADTAARVLASLQDILSRAPDAFNAGADLRRWALVDNGPPTQLRLYVWGNYFGSSAQLEAIIAPLRAIPGQGAPFTQTAVPRMAVLRQSRFSNGMGRADWQQLVADYAAHANPHSPLTLYAWGGAIARVPEEDSAFVHRQAMFNIMVTGIWNGAQEEQQMRSYLARWAQFMQPFWTGGIFQNFADREAPDYRENYWGKAFPALLAVKRKYDPDDVFAFEQSIRGSPAKVNWPAQVVEWLARPIQADDA